MHQTFYIDIDEEITSIVEKLKKARTSEIIMVVPKRALLIQSIVNLRILKKEADSAGLQLMMVTQDKLGKMLIEKVGIFVQQKMDNIADEEIEVSERASNMNDQAYGIQNVEIEEDEKVRLNTIGSDEYFSEGELAEKERESLERMKKTFGEKKIVEKNRKEEVVNKELVFGMNDDIKKRQPSMDISLSTQKKETSEKFISSENEKVKEQFSIPQSSNLKRAFPKDPSNAIDFSNDKKEDPQDGKIESFFYQRNNSPEQPKRKIEDDQNNYSLSGNSHKFFWIFGMIAVFVIAGIGAYLFLPKVNLKIVTKMGKNSVDSEIRGDLLATSLDYDKKIIPAKLVTIDEDILKSFDSTGDKAISDQKAKGKVIIYNEYSTSPQPLVATTRFLSEDDKLFRLVKGVTIPGMTKKDGESVPGFIEAEIVADQSGEEYNIEATKFTIPGFKGSSNDKYLKFYAKSEMKMMGGGTSSEKVNSVTQEDIDLAKKEISSEIDNFVKGKIKESAGMDVVILEDALKKEEVVYTVSNSPGDAASSFNVSAKMKVETIVVKDKDLKSMVGYMIADESGSQAEVDYDSIVLDFGKTTIDFEAGTIDIKFHVSGKMNPSVDIAEIRRGILGKNENDLKAYLSTFPDIKQIELNYWPSFINNKIPFRESRVEVTLDKQ